VGRRSCQPTEEEEKTLIPLLKTEYREALVKFMNTKGYKSEDEIDWINEFPTKTEFVQARLKKTRKDNKKMPS
jgi:hypothetical protein